jgi:hypothetical protein
MSRTPTARRRPAKKRPSRSRTSKISLSVDTTVLRAAKAAARRSGHTLSAHVTEALARDMRRRRLAEIIAEYEAEAGVITDEEVAAARATWRD